VFGLVYKGKVPERPSVGCLERLYTKLCGLYSGHSAGRMSRMVAALKSKGGMIGRFSGREKNATSWIGRSSHCYRVKM